ncbi:MAG: hypothetical protein ACI8W0_001917, partial [Flavobacterium sp.]
MSTSFIDKNSTALSVNQQAIWLEAKLHKNKPIFNIGSYAQINGILDFEILEQSIQNVISENDALRIRIGSISTIPEQFFEEKRNFTLKTHKFNALESAMNWMNKDFKSSVEIYSESLYSISLVIAESQCFLYFKHHHIYIDGWSRAQLLQKIAQHYNGILSLIEVNTTSSYKSYLETINNSRIDLDQSISFWKEEFSDINRVSLFSKKNAILQFAPSKRKRFVFPRDIYCKAQTDVKQDLKSKFYFLLASLYVTLSRSTGNQEIIFGVPLLNRFNETQKLTIGYFVGLIPLRINFSPDTSFLEIVKGIQTKMRSTVSYRNIAVHEINKSVGINFSNSSQLYDVIFSFEPHNHDCKFGEFEVTHAGTFSSDFVQTPLVVHVQDFNEQDDINFEFDYNLNYLSAGEVDVLISRFKNLLHYYIGNTRALVGNAPVLLKEEHIKLHDFGTGLLKELSSNNIISPILDKALEYPDQVI